MKELVTAEHVHGKTGLDGSNLPPPKIKLPDIHGVDWIIETLKKSETNSVTLCLFGPHTNIAMAMMKAPEIIPKIKEIVLMGGGFFEGGNVTPVAEFNIYVDPHAAKKVINCGRPITMIPLDVTHKALISNKWLNKIEMLDTSVSKAVYGMLNFYERHDKEKYGSNGGPLHDPTVIAYILEPNLFRGKKVNVEIEVNSELTMGMTVVDLSLIHI